MHDLYEDLILSHHKQPRNFRALPAASHRACLRNPTCGDEIELALLVEQGRITETAFHGQACAIARASASIATVALVGKTVAEARALAAAVTAAVRDGQPLPAADDHLQAVASIHRYPGRRRCATLAWEAAAASLAQG